MIETGIDDLQIAGKIQPRSNRHVVVHFDRIPELQAAVEMLAQKGKKAAAELGSGEAEAEAVIGAARHHPLSAEACEKGILNRVRVRVGGPEREKEANPMLRITVELPEILIEGIASTPAAKIGVWDTKLLVVRRSGTQKLHRRSRIAILPKYIYLIDK